MVPISPPTQCSVASGDDVIEHGVLKGSALANQAPIQEQVATSSEHEDDQNSDSDVDLLYAGPDHLSRLAATQDYELTVNTATEPLPEYTEEEEQDEDVLSTVVEFSESGHDSANDTLHEAFEVSSRSTSNLFNTLNESPDGASDVDIPIFPPDAIIRFICGAQFGPAPFLTEHLITSSPTAPFAGPHTAIQIPFGLDGGKWIHIPRNLRAAEFNLADLAIFWLWLGVRRNEGRSLEAETTSFEMAPSSPHQIQAHRMMGPPEAPFPMTDSTKPPFLGPRTFIKNTGRRLNATENLRRICNRPYLWASRHDADCTRGVKRTLDEEAELIDLLKQQKNAVVFLRDVIGLNFAVQDEPHGDAPPVWAKQTSIWRDPATLAKLCGGPYTPVLKPEQLHPEAPASTPCPVRTYGNVGIGSSPPTSSVVKLSSPSEGLRKRVADMQADLQTILSRKRTVRNEDLQPTPPSDNGSERAEDGLLLFPPSQYDLEYAAEDPPPLPLLTPSEIGEDPVDEEMARPAVVSCHVTEITNTRVTPMRSDRGFPDILRKLVFCTGVHSNVVLDFDLGSSSPIVNGTPMSNRFLIESPNYHQSIKAGMAVFEAAAPVHVQSIGTQCNLVIRTPAQAAALKAYIRRHLPFTKMDMFTELFTNLVWDIAVFVFYHVVLAILSYFIGFMMSYKHESIRAAIIRPGDVHDYYAGHPVQIIKTCFVVGTVCMFLVCPVWDLLRRMDAERRTQLYTVIAVAMYMYAGAVESAETWTQFPVIYA